MSPMGANIKQKEKGDRRLNLAYGTERGVVDKRACFREMQVVHRAAACAAAMHRQFATSQVSQPFEQGSYRL